MDNPYAPPKSLPAVQTVAWPWPLVTRAACLVAGLSGAVTFLQVAFGALAGKTDAGSLFALGGAGIMLTSAWGMRRNSRLAAIIAAAHFILSKVLEFSEGISLAAGSMGAIAASILAAGAFAAFREIEVATETDA